MKAIVLLSGGLDSAVVLALALEKGYSCIGLSFDYGQRHKIELQAAQRLATHYSVEHKTIVIDPNTFALSSLVSDIDLPENRPLSEIDTENIPNTYVPGRNTLFVAYAIGQAEIYEAGEIHVGPNLLDQKPYPDCRPQFYSAFQEVINVATKQAVEGNAPKLVTPLIKLDKRAIAQEAYRLGVPIKQTFSCYNPTPEGRHCHRCDTCIIRDDALIPFPEW